MNQVKVRGEYIGEKVMYKEKTIHFLLNRPRKLDANEKDKKQKL